MSEDVYPNVVFKVKLELLCLLSFKYFSKRADVKSGEHSPVLVGAYSVT